MYCGRLTPLGKTCAGCKRTTQSELSGLYVLVHFEFGAIHKLVQTYKQDRVPEIEPILARLIRNGQGLPLRISKPVITYVPLHPTRLRERGFNQAAKLGKILGGRTGFPVHNLLRQIRPTALVLGQNREKRLQHMGGAIKCPWDLTGYNVLLVDDIATTGATLEECARVLRAAGANEVWAWVVARGN